MIIYHSMTFFLILVKMSKHRLTVQYLSDTTIISLNTDTAGSGLRPVLLSLLLVGSVAFSTLLTLTVALFVSVHLELLTQLFYEL